MSKTFLTLTDKQIEIMKVILAGNGRDTAGNLIPVDMDQLLERIPYKTCKDSMHFSIRALIRRNMIYKGGREHRRNRQRATFFPTEHGRNTFNGSAGQSFIEPDNSDLLKILESNPLSAGDFPL